MCDSYLNSAEMCLPDQRGSIPLTPLQGQNERHVIFSLNLMSNTQLILMEAEVHVRVQPNLLPRWQPRLQPSLQLESPFLWPLLSMCSSSESNAPARKSGTQSLFLVELNMHPNRQFPAHFVVLPSCLHEGFAPRNCENARVPASRGTVGDEADPERQIGRRAGEKRVHSECVRSPS